MSKLIKLYVTEVKVGRLALEDVPSRLRPQVGKALEDDRKKNDVQK